MIDVIRKHFHGVIEKVDVAQRLMTVVASQEVVDRDGEVILADGIATTEFRLNPVFLLDHDRGKVFGQAVAWRVENRPKGRAWIVDIKILPGPGSNGWIDEAWAAIQAGARRGISIGFIPMESDRTPVLPGQTGVTHRRVEALEISSVSVPSCPTCVVEAKAWRTRRAGCGCGEVVLELEDDVMETKAGRVISAANLEHLQAVQSRHADIDTALVQMRRDIRDAQTHCRTVLDSQPDTGDVIDLDDPDDDENAAGQPDDETNPMTDDDDIDEKTIAAMLPDVVRATVRGAMGDMVARETMRQRARLTDLDGGIEPGDVAAVMGGALRSAIRESLGAIVAEEVAATLRRRAGRLD